MGLIKRLENYMENEPEASSALFEEHQTFEKLLEPATKISDKVGSQASAMIYSCSLDFGEDFQRRLGRVDQVLSQCAGALRTAEITSRPPGRSSPS